MKNGIILLLLPLLLCGCLETATQDELIELDEKLSDINTAIDTFQPAVTDAVRDVVATEYSGDKLVDIIRAADAANKASADVNPYSDEIDTGLKVAAGILGLFGATSVFGNNKKKRELDRLNKGIAKIERESDPETADKIHKAVNGIS